MKLIIAFALATSGSATFAQTHDPAPGTGVTAPQKPEAAAMTCPMMDASHKPQKGGTSGGMGGKKGMGGSAGPMAMQQSCPMMASGPKAGTPDTNKGAPEKGTDHADH